VGNPTLSVLKLGYNDLGDMGAHCIANSLCTEVEGNLEHRPVTVLDLSFNGIGDNGCESLALRGVAGNYHMRTLFLTGNNIREKGILSLAGALVHGCCLSRLHLSANKIGPEGIKALATAVDELDARQHMLESADALNSTMSESPNNGAAASPTKQRMEHLYLGSTSMESTGFYAIPSMLLSNTSLRVLCLTDNGIDDHDMSILSQALTQNKNLPLESILLSFNQITCAGVECLMNAVWGSPTLKVIKLDNNKMQDRGAQLCAVVLTSIKLEKLDVSFNTISTVGIRALMKSLSEDTNMKSLGICGIPIDLNAAKAVSFALAYNTALKTIYMDNCQIGYSAQRHIVAGIVSNQKAPLHSLTGFPLGRKFFLSLDAHDVCIALNFSNIEGWVQSWVFIAITPTLGMPQLPEEWSNDQVLAFVRLMWRNWGKKRGVSGAPSNEASLKDDGDSHEEAEEEVKGPAPPAAVAAAAKIAFASLGSEPTTALYVEPRQIESFDGDPNDTLAPLVPANAALIERTPSGRLQVPATGDAEGGDKDGFLEAWTESSARDRPAAVNYQVSGSSYLETPMDNPEQRNRNLRWLQTHFRPLIDVGNLPFNNADMWQLHQYYFSPPYFADEPTDSKPVAEEEDSQPPSKDLIPSPTAKKPAKKSDKVVAPPPTPVTNGASKHNNMGRAISFQTLSSAVAAAGFSSNASHKRRGHGEEDEVERDDEETPEEVQPAAKRSKSLKPRIAYYPRIRVRLLLTLVFCEAFFFTVFFSPRGFLLQAKLESLGTKPLEQTLSLLRKLKYVENVIFPEHTAYEELDKLRESDHALRCDVEMILLDLI
jgi:Ran GTPase-activating protein (RanGAP) involved in mRNA processing and transport